MRWEGQTVTAVEARSGTAALPGMGALLGMVDGARKVTTPDFEGVTFHEVLCKSALNPVPEAAALPFHWTINPYRGCTHACTYCFARATHEYLDFDAGVDFDSQIVVKTNVAAVLRRELRRASWKGETVALGTNTDPYQRAEGRYRLMPGIIGALANARTPMSILTKGTLLQRDLPLLATAATTVPVSISVSLALLDPELHATLEPGAPKPAARLSLIRAVAEAGFDCHVMAAPIIPYLTDDAASLRRLFTAVAEAGASGVTAFPLNLTGRYRGWFLAWLTKNHPALIRRYRTLYGSSGRVSPEYRTHLRARTEPLLAELGLGGEPLDGAGPYSVAPERRTRRRRDGVVGANAVAPQVQDLQEALF
ncbi:Rv2578c family radical SAM protein [Tsukamurella soli]|uniref:Rv2578c family radical SAM protein n=1 Tax=Tsukamurella soli TaxID=644556 RepID=UPI0031EF38F6